MNQSGYSGIANLVKVVLGAYTVAISTNYWPWLARLVPRELEVP